MATTNRKGPFRADHVGSMIRPPHLMDARKKHADGEITPAELRAIEDDCIREVVKLQEDGGLPCVTDGEFRRQSWNTDFLTGFDNVRRIDGYLKVFHRNADGTNTENRVTGMAIDGKLKRSHGIQTDDFKFLDALVSKVTKVCIPSPTLMHFRGGREAIDREAYPTIEPFYADLAAVYNEEVQELASLGLKYLQVDDTNLAYLCDPKFRDASRELGEDPDVLPATYCKLINESIRGLPDDVTVCIHLCRGNASIGGAATGGYEPVAEVLFNELNVDGFFLEYDSERAGGFEPLRLVPGGKTVVLGLMTTKNPELESKDELKRRVDEASKYVPMDQLALSPQCGFSSGASYQRALNIDDQKKKIARLVETAAEIWDDQ